MHNFLFFGNVMPSIPRDEIIDINASMQEDYREQGALYYTEQFITDSLRQEVFFTLDDEDTTYSDVADEQKVAYAKHPTLVDTASRGFYELERILDIRRSENEDYPTLPILLQFANQRIMAEPCIKFTELLANQENLILQPKCGKQSVQFILKADGNIIVKSKTKVLSIASHNHLVGDKKEPMLFESTGHDDHYEMTIIIRPDSSFEVQDVKIPSLDSYVNTNGASLVDLVKTEQRVNFFRKIIPLIDDQENLRSEIDENQELEFEKLMQTHKQELSKLSPSKFGSLTGTLYRSWDSFTSLLGPKSKSPTPTSTTSTATLTSSSSFEDLGVDSTGSQSPSQIP